MSATALLCEPARLDWSQPGGPRAQDFGDVYFSVEDGLEETRSVFLRACGLPEAWQGKPVFTVGELGFGTGLNALALWALWRAQGNLSGWLHLVSVEKHPLTRQDAERALSAWPQLKPMTDRLLQQWPSLFKGPHRLIFPEDRFSITIFQDEAEAALTQMDMRADAWFLDGFAPACNAAMWSQAVLDQIGRLSRPGARIGTFTVAGAVRRGLAQAGFEVSKQPGFGRKRERLEAIYGGKDEPPVSSQAPILIRGAGIAGASLARALRLRGRDVRVIDPNGVAGGASSAPAGLLTPRLEKADRPHVRATLAAFDFARRLYEPLAEFHPTGVDRLAKDDKEAERFSDLAGLMGEGYAWTGEMLEMAASGWFEPAALVARLLGDVPVAREGERRDGEILIHATGAHFDLDGDITPSAGRVGVFKGRVPDRPLSWGGYLAPTPQGDVLLGATHIKGWAPGEGDEALSTFHQDLASRRADLAETIDPLPVSSWGGVRASTPDRLPVAGLVSEETYVLSGLGSRGFAHAPLLAELIASQICHEPLPLERGAIEVFRPQRFAERRARRGG